MSSSSRTLEEATGARAGEIDLEYNPMDTLEQSADTWEAASTMYELVGRHDSQQEVNWRQDGNPALIGRDTMLQMWSNGSRAQAEISRMHNYHNLPDAEHDGVLLGGYDRLQSFGWQELSSGISENTVPTQEYQHNAGISPLGNNQERVMLTFPEGEDDAVVVSQADVEGLEPTKFLSNNIIDFYIKYLESRQISSEDRKRFHFFNSFFFTKLLGNGGDMDECEVDYEQVRKWNGDVDVFEKDYVFIPVLRSGHWSLIIICHLSSLTGAPDRRKGSPCILHLDPLEGRHESFQEAVRSYLYQACRERYQGSSKKDEMLLAVACELKYIRAKVPQQENGYDCGVYVLHYVEAFVLESCLQDFSFVASRRGPHFSNRDFAGEVRGKRAAIQKLIQDLRENPRERRGGRRMDIERGRERGESDMQCRNIQRSRLPKTPKGQSRSKKWSAEETSVLLNRMVAGGRWRKGSRGGTDWSVISEELKSVRSEEECRRRFDTLLKAYKTMKEYMERSGKAFCDIQGEELKKLKLATPLREEWYRDVERIWLQRKGGNGKSRKRAKLSSSDSKAKLDSVSGGAGAGGPSGSCERDRSCGKQVAIPGFSTLDEDLRCTLLNLVQSSYQRYWAGVLGDPIYPELEEICCWLTTVQDRKPSEIRRYVLQLWKLKFVKFSGRDSFDDGQVLNLVGLRVYRKFVEKVLCKIPALNTVMQICDNKRVVSFPEAPILSTLQRIRVLGLYWCSELKEVDLRNFPELRCLSIVDCVKLKTIRGWEVVKELGWLELCGGSFDLDSSWVERLPSLRAFNFSNGDKESRAPQVFSVVDFSLCVRLRRLKIWGGESLALQSMDVSRLSGLDVLALSGIFGLSTVEGLGGLHFLTKLVLSDCKALRRVPELGCLKALTILEMMESGVEEIPGVEELHLLTVLRLFGCKSLKWLPSLGKLKALDYLNIGDTGVEEIPGVEYLVSLKGISCTGSGLKWLPEPHHFPRLEWVFVGRTPLNRMDPCSVYHGKDYCHVKREVKREELVDDVSDIRDDSEYSVSDVSDELDAW